MMQKMSVTNADMVFADKQLVNKYVQFRPRPPQSLVNRVIQFLNKGSNVDNKAKLNSVDVGCGSGQGTFQYSPFFATVTGVDVSPDQIRAASENNNCDNVQFEVGGAEHLPFADKSVKLVTVCAAVHWFNFEEFYKEVDRVLQPEGVLAVYSYLNCTPLLNGKSYKATITGIWQDLEELFTPQHEHLKAQYKSLPSLYQEQEFFGEDTSMMDEKETTINDIVGYMSSWSVFPKLEKRDGKESAQKFIKIAKEKLMSDMNITDESTKIKVQFKYFLRMWKKPS